MMASDETWEAHPGWKEDLLRQEQIRRFDSGAVRSDDSKKPRWDLLPFAAIDQVAMVMEYGSRKYTDRNWERGIPLMRMVGSALRHVKAWVLGEELDPRSGLHHLSHAAWNILCLHELVIRRRLDLDDRPNGLGMAEGADQS